MPKIFQPPTLEEICCRNVGHNMDSLWCKDFNENIKDKADYLYLLGPFSTLPGKILTSLWRSLKENKLLRISHFQLLISPRLQELDLSSFTNNMSSILSTVQHTCVNLRSLNLSGNSKLPLRGMISLFSTLVHLETIDLSKTNTSDRVLSVIGAYCLNLRELNVSSTNVSDFGVTSLWASLDEGGATAAGSIEKLELSFTMSLECMIAALEHMPNLAQFVVNDTLSAVAALVERGRTPNQPLNLTSLDGDPLHLPAALPVCPHVTSVVLNLPPSLSYSHLVPLERLTALDDLCLVASNEYPTEVGERLSDGCRMSDALVRVLSACGSHLTSLTLNTLQDIPGSELLRLCPRLTCLALVDLSWTQESSDVRWSALSQLRRLALAGDGAAPLLLAALSSPELEQAELISCPEVTDLLLETVLNSGGLRSLTALSLRGLDALSPEVVHRLVLECPRLERLGLHWCGNVHRRHADQLRTLVRQQDWTLDIVWE